MVATKSETTLAPSPQAGFTILELLIVLSIIGFFAVAVGSRLANVIEKAGATTALEEMNNIKTAIVDLFYPDLGFIPEDPGPNGKLAGGAGSNAGWDDRPWYATRYLCLADDRDGTSQSPNSQTAPQSYAMWIYLRSQIDRHNPNGGTAKAGALAKMAWDRYRQKGWRGPYMEQDTLVKLDADDTVSMPLIATPWADKCEKLAQQAEDAGDDSEAERLRRGNTYLIVTDTKTDDDGNAYSDKTTARIVSFGADCEDSGSYERNDAVGYTTATTLRKPNVDDEDNPDVYYTGDDIVVFVFGGGTTRKPAD